MAYQRFSFSTVLQSSYCTTVSFSIQDLMEVDQESIRGMRDNLNQLHHLQTELRLLISHINLQSNTQIVSVRFEEESDDDDTKIFVKNLDPNIDFGNDIRILEGVEIARNIFPNEEVKDENVIDTWEKFQNFFEPDFLQRCQNFVQELEEELTKLKSNMRNLHRAAFDIVLETEPIRNSTRRIVIDIEGMDITTLSLIIWDMENVREIFPHEEEEENDENDEESRPINDAWRQCANGAVLFERT